MHEQRPVACLNVASRRALSLTTYSRHALEPPALLDDPRISQSARDEILGVFMKSLVTRMETIEKALREHDRGSLIEAVHAIAGSAGLFAYTHLLHSARAIERQAREDAGFDLLQPMVAELLTICQEIAVGNG